MSDQTQAGLRYQAEMTVLPVRNRDARETGNIKSRRMQTERDVN